MTPYEAQLLEDLLVGLRGQAAGPRDPDAARRIAQEAARVPDLPYLLAQQALQLGVALKEAQRQMAELQRPAMAGQGGSSFLGGGRAGPQPAPPPPAWSPSAPAAPYPSTPYAPLPAYPPAAPVRGPWGGFLRGAAQTATGVAGGFLAAEAIGGLLGGHGFMGGGENLAHPSETIIENNYFGDAAGDTPVPDQEPDFAQDAGYDGGDLDGSGDDGSGDDWA